MGLHLGIGAPIATPDGAVLPFFPFLSFPLLSFPLLSSPFLSFPLLSACIYACAGWVRQANDPAACLLAPSSRVADSTCQVFLLRIVFVQGGPRQGHGCPPGAPAGQWGPLRPGQSCSRPQQHGHRLLCQRADRRCRYVTAHSAHSACMSLDPRLRVGTVPPVIQASRCKLFCSRVRSAFKACCDMDWWLRCVVW